MEKWKKKNLIEFNNLISWFSGASPNSVVMIMWDGSLRIGFFLMELMPRFVLANKTTLILHVPCFLCSCPLQWHILKNQKPMNAGRKSSCFSCSFLYILFFNIWVMTVTSVLWWCSFLDVMDLLHRGRLEERLLIRLFKEDFDLGMDSFFFFWAFMDLVCLLLQLLKSTALYLGTPMSP